MSDYINAEMFELGKKSYETEAQMTFKMHVALRDTIDHPHGLSKKDIGENCAIISLLDLAAASAENSKTDGFCAHLFFNEAEQFAKKAHRLHADTGELDKILKKVKLEID